MADLGDLSANDFNPGPLLIMTNPGANMKTWANRLAGTVTVNGSAAEKRIVVLLRKDLSYVASTFSLADGTWSIAGLPESLATTKMLVMAFDDTETYNVEAADNVVPVV